MQLKAMIREKVKRFLGIKELEDQFRKLANPDLVRHLEIRARSSSAEFIEQHMAKARALQSGDEVIDFAIKQIPPDLKGLFCEFGVYQGNTINHIARQTKSKVYGFDSFEGLPEFWRDGFPAGAFELKKEQLPKCEGNVELVVGWFDKSLPPFAGAHPEPLAFLHVDCDLYSSTQTVFKILGQRLVQGSVIVFDEYFNYPGWQEHEHRAFIEYAKEAGRRFEYICYNRNHEQVAVKII
jgi:hypothetical protein